MAKDLPASRSDEINEQGKTIKTPYEPPVLEEHGDAAEVTQQTFFGSFSPEPSD